MTKEEKFKKLLDIAVNNGFDIEGLPHLLKCCLEYSFKLTEFNQIESLPLSCSSSLNDLIIDFEDDKISFIDALCDNKTIKTNPNNLIVDNTGTLQIYVPAKNHAQLVQFQWIMEPTSKRLDWLFETFKHLLN